MLDLSDPTPDFTQLSTGLGVPARRVTTAEELDRALREAYAEPGPHLIEAIVPGDPAPVRRRLVSVTIPGRVAARVPG